MRDAVQRKAARLIIDPPLMCHLQSLPHRRAVGDLSLSNDAPPSSLSIMPAVILHSSRTGRYDRIFVPRVSRAWNGLPGRVFIEPSSVGLFP
nr:unnamed protein product [Callosobruchus chinensis]